MAVLGTLIDRSPNIFGVIPGFIEEGDPHPDALAVGRGVRRLNEIGFDVPDGWMPFPEFDDPHGLIAVEVERVVSEVRLKGDRLGGRHLVALVTGAAILGHGPDWSCEQPSFRLVEVRGKPRWFMTKKVPDSLGRVYEIEVDGFDAKRQRPMRGAYRKYELSRMMRSEILSRLDWQLWQDALEVLGNLLAGQLSAHRIAAFSPDRQPWARKKKYAGAGQVSEKA
ncbi:MAG: hypothetical protein ACT6RT_10950 [Allorhizobium sp.]